MPHYINQLIPTYYDTLINWDVVEEILDMIDEDAQAEAYTILFDALDYAVLHVVLVHLPGHHHESFLELCTHQHHEPSLLTWLEDHSQGITEHIRVTIHQTKLEVKQQLLTLSNEASPDGEV